MNEGQPKEEAWRKKLQQTLFNYWGYAQFRPFQEDIALSAMLKKDVLALLPTGGGKSICFQVPTMAQEGLCLVISPLIALMKDQVQNLRKKGITAFALTSELDGYELRKILETAGRSNCKFLYLSPERLQSKLFLEFLPSLQINLIAVDEAHCISQWGYDFRPSYRKIIQLREELPQVPIIALTASATPKVQQDICHQLGFQHHNIFQSSFNRPNIAYSIEKCTGKISRMLNWVHTTSGTGIVYCKSRKRTEEIARVLQQQGISADFYHAGLPADVRASKQEDWIKNKIRIIVCTNAFGMGIDKPDVRLVIHYDTPDSLEHYYQEAGRAGRDGLYAKAVLLYEDKDPVLLKENLADRFPGFPLIQDVYKKLMNYLQLEVDSGEGQFFVFQPEQFYDRFQLPPHIAYHCLKAIEQDGWFQLSEQGWKSSEVAFVCSKEFLREIQAVKPEWNELLLCLLRNYAGIFDYPHTIKEKQLVYWCSLEEEEVINLLHALQKAGVIKYQEAIKGPQLFFLRNRVHSNEFRINEAQFLLRKKIYTERLEAMLNYLFDNNTCRSVRIGKYFGDLTIKPCGICDLCLKENQQAGPPNFTTDQAISPGEHQNESNLNRSDSNRSEWSRSEWNQSDLNRSNLNRSNLNRSDLNLSDQKLQQKIMAVLSEGNISIQDLPKKIWSANMSEAHHLQQLREVLRTMERTGIIGLSNMGTLYLKT